MCSMGWTRVIRNERPPNLQLDTSKNMNLNNYNIFKVHYKASKTHQVESIVYYDVGYRFYKSYYNVTFIGGKLLFTRRQQISNRNCRRGKQ